MIEGYIEILTPLDGLTEADITAAIAAVNRMVCPAHFGGADAIGVGLRVDSDETVQVMNRDFRGFDKPTNVLSFPAEPGTLEPEETYLGDVILAVGVLQREAVALGISVKEHGQHLVIHGILHVMGFDHMTPAEAAVMEALEILILEQLGIENPYE